MVESDYAEQEEQRKLQRERLVQLLKNYKWELLTLEELEEVVALYLVP
jgi:hypothetical protein